MTPMRQTLELSCRHLWTCASAQCQSGVWTGQVGRARYESMGPTPHTAQRTVGELNAEG